MGVILEEYEYMSTQYVQNSFCLDRLPKLSYGRVYNFTVD